MTANTGLAQQKSRKRLLWQSAGIVALILLAVTVIGIQYIMTHAGPILRSRVVQTLSRRFKSQVELDGFQVSVANGVEVSGTGLEIYGLKDPNLYQPGVQPLIAVREFRFQTSLRSLLRSPMHVDTVYVKGMVLNVPPKQTRQEMTSVGAKAGRMSIFVDKFVCEDTRLILNTVNPEKPPLEFAISMLRLQEIKAGQPLRFDATLVNPKPVGNIHSTGWFGPWQPDAPRDTALQGDYSFTHAELNTIRGIGGTLSSTGHYSGTLNNIAVHGATDTPDFRLASSGHAVHLRTEFHAVVDGMSGDTYLRPVKATFLHTTLTAKGSVVRTRDRGHDVELEVFMDTARVEDLLELGVRTTPPVMAGPVDMRTRMSLPPGKEAVTDRLNLDGDFHILQAHFSNPKVQEKIDALSLRSLGRGVKGVAKEDAPVDLQGVFTLRQGLLSFSVLHFLIPGTHVDMAGNYSLDGRQFDFHGTARLDARLSQMTTGWKSALLKPLDPFFSKDGAGTEVPIKIMGTESAPHFGLDFHHKADPGSGLKKTDTLSRR